MGGVFIYRGVGSNFGKNVDHLYRFECGGVLGSIRNFLGGVRGGRVRCRHNLRSSQRSSQRFNPAAVGLTIPIKMPTLRATRNIVPL